MVRICGSATHLVHKSLVLLVLTEVVPLAVSMRLFAHCILHALLGGRGGSTWDVVLLRMSLQVSGSVLKSKFLRRCRCLGYMESIAVLFTVVIVIVRRLLGVGILYRFWEVCTFLNHCRAFLINIYIYGHLILLDLSRWEPIKRFVQVMWNGWLRFDVFGGKDARGALTLPMGWLLTAVETSLHQTVQALLDLVVWRVGEGWGAFRVSMHSPWAVLFSSLFSF